jgi:hypothetical protein
LPFVSIGGQQIKGYSDSEWNQFLDAAGYPAKSVLPATYRNPAATPLVVVQKPVNAGQTDAARKDPSGLPPPPAAANSPSNPAGIQF